MKKAISFALVLLFSVGILTGCKASETYQGTWYGINENGESILLEIAEKSLTIKDSDGGETYELKQTGTGFNNSTTYYTFTLDGTTYSLVYPEGKTSEFVQFTGKGSGDDTWDGPLVFVLSRDENADFSKFL